MTIKNNPPPSCVGFYWLLPFEQKKSWIAILHNRILSISSRSPSSSPSLGRWAHWHASSCTTCRWEKKKGTHTRNSQIQFCVVFIYALTGRVRSVLRPQPHSAQLRKARQKGTKQRMTQVFFPFRPSNTGEFTLAAKSFTFATLLFPLFLPEGKILQRRRMGEGRTRVAFFFFFQFCGGGIPGRF